jgi:hypothetical protein
MSTNETQGALLAPDHCKLRPLNEIKSTMCDPSPIPTSVCIIPAVTNKSSISQCAKYRYDTPDEIIKQLNNKGYYVFKNMIARHKLDIGKKYFDNNGVNYVKLKKEFIIPFLLNNIGNQINQELENIEYKVSDKKSVDTLANNFHRDLHIKTNENRVDCFTIQTYLDGGSLELIPRSNRIQNIKLSDIHLFQNSIEKIHLDPGDVVIFEMAIMHRQLYQNNSEGRLIQLLNTVYKKDLNYFLDTTTFVLCDEKCQLAKDKAKNPTKFTKLLRTNKTLTNFFNHIGFYNAAIGYSKMPVSSITTKKNIKYFTNELNQSRMEVIEDKLQIDNRYISNYETKKLSAKEKDKFIINSFYLNVILLSVFSFLILFVLILLVVLVFK